MTTRRQFLAAITLAAPVALSIRPAFAQDASVLIQNGYGADGADVVAYFTEEAAREGSEEHVVMHEGVEYKFVSAENAAAFEADPEAYLPQYGGYCAYAVSQGYTADGDRDAWTVHDGKLYLNVSKPVRFLWNRNRDENIEAGDANWPGVLG